MYSSCSGMRYEAGAVGRTGIDALNDLVLGYVKGSETQTGISQVYDFLCMHIVP